MKFAAIGRTRWLYDAILACVEKGHEPALIATCAAAPEYGVREEDFRQLAAKLGIDFLCESRLATPEILERIGRTGAEIAISVNWCAVLPERVLSAFPRGIVNAHAGDLPRFRGNACPNWAILAGERQMVVTLHQMSEQLDAGPIFLQRSVPIGSETYIGDLHRALDTHIPEMFAALLDGLAANRIVSREQPSDARLSLRCFPRAPADGLIDWAQSADAIARLVRASSDPFQGAFTYLDGGELVVWRAKPWACPYPFLAVPGQVCELHPESGEVMVATGTGMLSLQEVSGRGHGGRFRAADMIRSTRTRLGLSASRAFPVAPADRPA